MSRVKTGIVTRRRHKSVLAQTKGFRMTKSRLYKVAHEALLHAGQYAFVGRKLRKRDFRRLWITRISAGLGTVESSLNYSRFIAGLKTKNIELDRKSLADIAATDLEAFKAVVKQVEAK
jgi:large subunit ribosomal protein L20